MNPAWSAPILPCVEARALEQRLFGGDGEREWPAMQRAGAAVARAVLDDFLELGGFPAAGRVLVLAGKGHNGGDALLAAQSILARHPAATVTVWFAFGERTLRPLALRAWQELLRTAGGRATKVSPKKDPFDGAAAFELCLDGIFGFQFRPPIDDATAAVIQRVNADSGIRLRAAVDLPSGLGEKVGDPVMRADFTYATGIVKAPAVDPASAASVGRLRYLDLGFFRGNDSGSKLRVLTPRVLDPLRGLRTSATDKRAFGHVFLLGGSRRYPGAVLMAARAALRSGVGLVTAFVPASLAAAYAAVAPEAMWVAWPETAAGGLAVAGLPLLRERLERATALVLGPGLGAEAETRALATEIVQTAAVPLVLDADALQAEVAWAGTAPRVLTPHAGELARIMTGEDHRPRVKTPGAVLVLKGRLTTIMAGDAGWLSPFGGPVLARGGSGDLLAGLIGGLLAQAPGDPLLAACRGVVWHGLAADLLARHRGQVAVQVTQLLDHLPAALRAASHAG